jgi:hypothetical protein
MINISDETLYYLIWGTVYASILIFILFLVVSVLKNYNMYNVMLKI